MIQVFLCGWRSSGSSSRVRVAHDFNFNFNSLFGHGSLFCWYSFFFSFSFSDYLRSWELRTDCCLRQVKLHFVSPRFWRRVDLVRPPTPPLRQSGDGSPGLAAAVGWCAPSKIEGLFIAYESPPPPSSLVSL